MRYVLDSNIALKWVLPEADSDKARLLRAEYQNQIHELLAPDVFPVEVAHGLTKAERRGIIPMGDADRLLTNIPRLLRNFIPICYCSSERLRLPPEPVSGFTIAFTSLSPSGRVASC